MLFYPAINNIIFVYKQNQVISDYNAQIVNLDDQTVKDMEEQAQEYNDKLASAYVEQTVDIDADTDTDTENEQPVSSNLAYSQLLNISEEQMGYIVIPKISLNQPVYHGTDDAVLERGIGHMENTSLPVGGENTHAVLTGHTGVPGMMLFTDLEQMEVGDRFYLKILNKTLAYEVDNIRVVLPNVTEYFKVVPNEDLVTLVTCTPYGVNSHRLLVRGTRVDYNGEIDNLNSSQAEQTPTEIVEGSQATTDEKETTEFSRFSKEFVLYYIAIPSIVSLLLILLLITVLKKRKKRAIKLQSDLNEEN